MRLFLVFCCLAAGLRAAPAAVQFSGRLTNTTAGVAAPAALTMTRDGKNISVQLVTQAPLTGAGTLTGVCLDGWCDLSGSLGGGWTAKFRGVLNAAGFRGTYTVVPAGGQSQYGRFEFIPVAPQPEAKPPAASLPAK